MNGDYFEYKGVKYGIGTQVIVDDICYGRTNAIFYGWQLLGSFRWDNRYITDINVNNINDKIIMIVQPVYWSPPEPKPNGKKCNIFTRTGSGSWQSDDEVVHGLIWYIVVMLLGTIFNDRLIIWIAATIIFFSWKHGK